MRAQFSEYKCNEIESNAILTTTLIFAADVKMCSMASFSILYEEQPGMNAIKDLKIEQFLFDIRFHRMIHTSQHVPQLIGQFATFSSACIFDNFIDARIRTMFVGIVFIGHTDWNGLREHIINFLFYLRNITVDGIEIGIFN